MEFDSKVQANQEPDGVPKAHEINQAGEVDDNSNNQVFVEVPEDRIPERDNKTYAESVRLQPIH